MRAGSSSRLSAPSILLRPFWNCWGGPEMSNVEGASLCSLLHGRSPLQSPPAYAETFEAHRQFGFSPLRCLRLDDWKFILAPPARALRLEDRPG